MGGRFNPINDTELMRLGALGSLRCHDDRTALIWRDPPTPTPTDITDPPRAVDARWLDSMFQLLVIGWVA